MNLHFKLVLGVLLFAIASPVDAALVTNPALPLTHRVSVQPIIVSDNNGTNTAEYFGTASQELSIKSLIDDVWIQAGIDVDFLTPNTWNNTFANVGSNLVKTVPRPTSDLNTVVSNGQLAGVANPDPLVINIYFVEIAAGFADPPANNPPNPEVYANGLAFVGGNGITQHVGDDLPGFLAGREVVAAVVAHEIGHNLGLIHLDAPTDIDNLMFSSSTLSRTGEELNSTQIATALGSQFSIPITAVPEPSSMAVLTVAACGYWIRRRRGKVAPAC